MIDLALLVEDALVDQVHGLASVGALELPR